MAHQFSLAHLSVLTTSPVEMVEIAAKTGYDFVSFRLTAVTATEHVFALQSDRAMMNEVKARLAATGVKVLDIELCRMPAEIEPETYIPVLEAAAELGARHILAQLPDPNRERATDRFGRLCDLAAPYKLTVDLEYPSWPETPNTRRASKPRRLSGKLGLLSFERPSVRSFLISRLRACTRTRSGIS